MLILHEDIYCGIFDSSIARKNISRSERREVKCFEIEIFHTASGTSFIDGEKYPAKRGMILISKPSQVRRSEFPVRCSFIRIFETEHTSGALTELLSRLPDCTYLDDDTLIDELLAKFSRLGSFFASSQEKSSTTALINSLFYDIIYHIVSITGGDAKNENIPTLPKVAREAYEYINENYSSDCSLATIASAVNVTPNYLHTVFTSSLGISPYQYTVNRRIEKAKKLIMVGDMSMLRIALELGFCSQSHFNKIFKEQTGETPTQFRKRIFENY